MGFGTWQSKDGEEAYQAVKAALDAGYRHIDTAAAYGNEESVGKAIKDSGVAREDLFVTSKLWNEDHGYEATKKALDLSLQKLGLDYLDLYLIHWPNPVKFRDEWQQKNAESWRAMEEALEAGKVRAIGVSNFRPHHLDELLKTAKVTPAVNQIFLNPSDTEDEVVAYNKEHGILSEAYSPLGTGKIFSIPELKEIAEKYLSYDYFLDEVEEVRQKLGIDHFYLIGQSWGGALTMMYALKYGEHLKGAIISSMVDNIDEYLEHQDAIRDEALAPEDAQFMRDCEKSGDWDNERYQKLVDVLNAGYVDRKQPVAIRHLVPTMATPVYNAFQGDNEFVVTGKLKEWDVRDQIHNIKV
ncbi:proline iminopeptidase-family hydrolase, partial [Pediococcus acidilactici]|nr:proline iminopeptidase-family hydrolase [Pediococcus acidilactici]